jgi:hypothetical protein
MSRMRVRTGRDDPGRLRPVWTGIGGRTVAPRHDKFGPDRIVAVPLRFHVERNDGTETGLIGFHQVAVMLSGWEISDWEPDIFKCVLLTHLNLAETKSPNTNALP